MKIILFLCRWFFSCMEKKVNTISNNNTGVNVQSNNGSINSGGSTGQVRLSVTEEGGTERLKHQS